MSLPYRLLFLDLDGTLVGQGDVISSRTLDALHRAQRRGCALVICTGRSRYAAQHIAAQIGGESGYGIASNGSVVSHWAHPHPLQKSTLSGPVTQEAIRISHNHGLTPLCLGLEDDDRVIHGDRRLPLPPSYVSAQGTRLAFCEDVFQEITRRNALPMSIDVHGEDERAVAGLAQAWHHAFGAEAIVYHCFVERFGCWGAYLNPAATGKARAAQWVAEALDVPREQTFAVGDYLNDLDLLKWAGLGVCMGDGHEDARACAHHVTGTLAEDGVAQAIERFVLFRVAGMKRIALIGPGGAGKSTLARQIGQKTGLPVIHLDSVYWHEGWTETPKDVWAQTMCDLTLREVWITDGNYGGTMDIRLAAADTIVFLDLPPLLCVWRVLRRQLRYRGRTRPDMAPGCPEKLDLVFLKWIWNYRRDRRPGILRAGRSII